MTDSIDPNGEPSQGDRPAAGTSPEQNSSGEVVPDRREQGTGRRIVGGGRPGVGAGPHERPRGGRGAGPHERAEGPARDLEPPSEAAPGRPDAPRQSTGRSGPAGPGDEPDRDGPDLGGPDLGGLNTKKGRRRGRTRDDRDRRPWERKDENDPALRDASVLVIGLGRFGSAIASTLERLGQDVLAVERSSSLVAQWSGQVALVQADATNPVALEQLGARDFPVAVVGVGSSLEASVLITGNLVDLGTPQIWAKAVSEEHGRILQRIGAHHVVFPEADAGSRVAHLVSGKLLDYIEVEDGFTIVKMRPPREVQGFTLEQSKVLQRYGVTIIGVKSPGEEFLYATPQTRISRNDLLIVGGHAELLERFAARP